jgi:hypothetical protein
MSFLDEIKKFNKKFNVNFNLDNFEADQDMFDSFPSGPTDDISDNDQLYRDTFLDLYAESVENAMFKNTPLVDHVEFYTDFEKLMANYRKMRIENKKSVSTEYGEWTSGVDILKEMSEEIKNISPNKVNFVKEKYLQGKFPLRKMRADIEEIKKAVPPTAETLSRAIAYYKALEETRAVRTVRWKANPLNWIRNRAEKRDLKDFKAYIEQQQQEYKNISDDALKIAMSSDVLKIEKESLQKSIFKVLSEMSDIKPSEPQNTNDPLDLFDPEVTKNPEYDIQGTLDALNNVLDLQDIEDIQADQNPQNDQDFLDGDELQDIRYDLIVEEPKNDDLSSYFMDDEEIVSNPTTFDDEESFEEEVITDISNAFNAEAERRKNRTKDTLEEQKIKYQQLQRNKKERKETPIEDKPQTKEEAINIYEKRKLLSYAVCERMAECFEDAKDTEIFLFNTARIIYNSFGKILPTIWESPNEMDTHAKNIFKQVYGKIKVNTSVEKKLVAAQEITDIMLNIYSPVASNENLKMYGECYAIQSMDNSDIQKLTGCNDNIDELMQSVKEDLGLVKKPVKFKDEEFKEAPVATVPKIEEVKHDALYLNNGK